MYYTYYIDNDITYIDYIIILLIRLLCYILYAVSRPRMLYTYIERVCCI